MSAIRSTDTRPEMVVRRLLHRLGYRYRLHATDLPGKPDLVFPVRRKVIFVHGCFWHRHDCPLGRPVPATRREFWREKFAGNVRRDAENIRKLRASGWKIVTVWECEVRKLPPHELAERLIRFLD